MEISMTGIAKAFGTNQVLRDVSITLKAGEVHALMGENGAGKSTLMNILTGIHKADAGTITIDGVETTYPNPREAEKHGVAFIHQELNIWPNLTLLENLYLMRPIKNAFGMHDNGEMRGIEHRFAAHQRGWRMFRWSTTDDGNSSYSHARCEGRYYGRTDGSPHRTRNRHIIPHDAPVEIPWRSHRVHFPPHGGGVHRM